ncbi:alpha/beta hydrolase [Marinobacteraceae bacterium S3BR75-40.1]
MASESGTPLPPNPSPLGPSVHLNLPDGRILSYADYGDPQGMPIIFAHGMPGSRMEGRFFHDAALAAGFRLICMDRPGIGQSTFQPQRVLMDYPDDVETLADALGLDDFVHMGWSSGGSRTLACAFRLPQRVRLAVVLSGYTHFEELPDAKQLLMKTRWPGPVLAEFSPRLFRWVVTVVAALSRLRPRVYLRQADHLVSEHDRALLAHPRLRTLFRMDQVACVNSPGRAIAKDLETEMTNWGFNLADVQVPTLIYQGQQDPFVPVQFARHMAEHLPHAELELLPEAGHLYPLDEDFQQTLFQNLRAKLQQSASKAGAIQSSADPQP